MSKTFLNLSKPFPKVSKPFPWLSKPFCNMSKTFLNLSKPFRQVTKSFPKVSEAFPDIRKRGFPAQAGKYDHLQKVFGFNPAETDLASTLLNAGRLQSRNRKPRTNGGLV